MILNLIYFMVFCSGLKTITAQSCDPALDCSMFGHLGVTVPDPTNCENYYVCLDDGSGNSIPSATPFTCSSGEYYNAAPLNEAGCVPKTIPGVCDQNYCGIVLGSEINVCDTKCPAIVPAFVADPENCSFYYICLSDGELIQSSCQPEALYFNGTSCVSDESQCCDFGVAYCTTLGAQIPDPNDCTSYYICGSANEIPSESYRRTCPDGQYYDAATFNCIDGTCQF